MMKTNKISNHWSQYWKTGQLTSLPQDFQKNYTGEIQQQWTQVFNNLNKNSHILDVCTGNCAIALLSASRSKIQNKNFKITAIDAADINRKSIEKRFPDQISNLNKIQLISNCKVEDIELANNEFDLITSQYGIEYCHWEKAAQQVHRLLKTKGNFVMIAHSGSTEIIKTMKVEKSDYEFLKTIEIFQCFDDYCCQSINYAEFIKQLKTKQKLVIKRFNNQPSELMRALLLATDGILFMQRNILEANKIELIKMQQQYHHAHQRLNDLFRVTQAINNNPNWHEVFIQSNLRLIEKRNIFQNGIYQTGTFFKFIKS